MKTRLAALLVALLAIVGCVSVGSVSAAASPENLFGSTVPAVKADTDAAAVELGVQFRPAVDGTVSGVRFYKGTGNTGTHSGSVWSAAGVRLVTKNFTGETSTGWQTVTFTTPLAVTGGTTYTASYLAPRGHYAVNNPYTWPKAIGNLTGLAGTYRYGATSGFPTSVFQTSNYWVDVVFTASTTTPPTTTPPATTTATPTTTAAPTTTTAPPTQTLNCSAHPSACGFADETNTGVLPGVTLTKVPSEATSGQGWACDSPCRTVNFTGNVGTATTGLELADGINAATSANNITIKNVKLLGVHGQSSDGIWVGPTTNGVTIDHCDITGAPDTVGTTSTLRGWAGVHIKNGATNYAVNYCHIRGFSGPIFPEQEKGNDVFVGNYAHHIVGWDNAGTDHCNVWGNGGGPDDLVSSQLIKDNTFWGDHPSCMSSSISMFPDGHAQTNQHTTIEHNLISGGAYCLNPGSGDQFGAAGRSYIGYKNNHWSIKNSPNCGYYGLSHVFPLDASSGAGNYQCGNVWDDGPFAGSGADQDNWYPTTMRLVTAC